MSMQTAEAKGQNKPSTIQLLKKPYEVAVASTVTWVRNDHAVRTDTTFNWSYVRVHLTPTTTLNDLSGKLSTFWNGCQVTL